MMDVDPRTGMRYIHVIPASWGPLVDIRACWKALSRRRPWTHVFTQHELEHHWMGYKTDPTNFFIVWDQLIAQRIVNDGRRATLALVYSEALDEDGAKLLPAHLDVWHRFKDIAPNLDLVFAHTPWMCDMLRRTGLPAFVMPAGWDAETMGIPRWDTYHHKLITYHGSMAGRREVIIPWLKNAFSKMEPDGISRFDDVSGCYGRALLGRFDQSATSLYVAHSEVRSFSTWRLWQVASTATALIAEPGDTWPFEAGKHYFEIPRFNLDNMDAIARYIYERAHERDRGLQMAGEAHELARKYTVDHIEDEFIVPAAVPSTR